MITIKKVLLSYFPDSVPATFSTDIKVLFEGHFQWQGYRNHRSQLSFLERARRQALPEVCK